MVRQQKEAAIGVPTVKQFYIQLKKDEVFLVLFAHLLAARCSVLYFLFTFGR